MFASVSLEDSSSFVSYNNCCFVTAFAVEAEASQVPQFMKTFAIPAPSWPGAGGICLDLGRREMSVFVSGVKVAVPFLWQRSVWGKADLFRAELADFFLSVKLCAVKSHVLAIKLTVKKGFLLLFLSWFFLYTQL